MATVKIDLYDFALIVGFWAGAEKIWNNLTDDQKEILNNYIEDVEFDSLAEINDWVWFDAMDIIEEFAELEK